MTKKEIIDMLKEDFNNACDHMKRQKYGSSGYCVNCSRARMLGDQLDAIFDTTEHMNKVYSIDVSKAYETM